MKKNVKRKYLHIEIDNGHLYLYADNKAWINQRTLRLKDIDTECNIADINSNPSFKILIDDFIN